MGHSTVSYLSQLRRRLCLRVWSLRRMELRQHDFPLLVVNEDHLVLVLLVLLLFLSSILCISPIKLLLVGLQLSYFSI